MDIESASGNYLPWFVAEGYLNFLFLIRDNELSHFDPKNYETIVPLKRRFDSGERTVELYDAIMNSI